MLEEPFNHTQAFQQAIATTITCRTIIKYNSNLSAEQQAEILAEIENTLAFLSKRPEVNASIETSTTPSPEKLADLVTTRVSKEEERDEEPLEMQRPTTDQEKLDVSLQQLYKLYRAYLSHEPGKGVAALETRYRTVMGVLDQLQELVELRHDATAGDLTVEGLLSRVRGFVTAVYCMFREFAVLLTKIAEGRNIDMDTEALALLQKYPLETERQQQLVRDITPLIYVYKKHLRLQERRGTLYDSAGDTTAFLIFLPECLEQTFARRKEVAEQIKSTVGLFNELTGLLLDYEVAVANIMQSPSRSL